MVVLPIASVDVTGTVRMVGEVRDIAVGVGARDHVAGMRRVIGEDEITDPAAVDGVWVGVGVELEPASP